MNYQYQENQQDKFLLELKKFVTCLKQQILCPDILTFQRDLFSDMNKSVKIQQSSIKTMIKQQNENNQSKPHTTNNKQQIYKCETEKLNYILKQYLRVRIKKIQKFCFYLYKNQAVAEKKLSENQYTFMRAYAQMKYRYLQDNVLKNIVKPYRGLAGLETFFAKTNEVKPQIDTKQSKIQVPEPPMNDYVFCLITANPELYRFNSDIPATNISENSIIGINSTIFGRYKYFSKILNDSNGQLV